MSLVMRTNDELKSAFLNLSEREQEMITSIVEAVNNDGIVNVDTSQFEDGEFDSKPKSRFAESLAAENIHTRGISGHKEWIRCQIAEEKE